MSAGAVRAGGVFVEIGADPKKFFAALNSVNKSLANMGKGLVSGGGRLAAMGAGMAAPIVAAVGQGARFESTLLNIKASTGATAGEINQIKAASMDMSKALGVGPTAAAQGMLELLKAGMSLESVLGGAGKSALEFAKVGEMDVAQAAVVMSDAMNVFGVSGAKAADTLSAAADASSTSIQEMSQAFSMSSAVAGLANQSIDDLSAALAILANNGVKGSDAGTSVKTMLMRLMAPADDAAAALAQVGLSTQSFRGADGKMLPMVEIIRTLNAAIGGLDQTAKDDVFRRIFGADAIRAASILSSTGADGFKAIQDAMASAMPVSEKFKTLMSGLYGAGQQVLSALERLAIAVSGAVAPALDAVVPVITGFIDGLANLARENPAAVAGFAQIAIALVGVGGAMTGVGYALQVLSGAFGVVLKSIGLFAGLVNPVTLVVAAIAGAGVAAYKFKDQIGAALGSVAPSVQEAAGAIGQGFNAVIADAGVVFGDLYSTATTTFNGIYDAIAAGDLSGAMDVLWAGLIAGWLRGTEAIMSYVDPWIATFQNAFTILGAEIYKTWDGLWVSVGNALNIAGAYLQGAMDNIINPILASWDVLEAGIRKAWIRISGLFKDGDTKKAELEKVDAEMRDRAAKRSKDRPGVSGRVAKAQEENAQANADLATRNAAVDAGTQATMDARNAATDQAAADRRAATKAAEQRLGDVTRGQTEGRAMKSQADDLLASIRGATSVEQLAGAGGLGDQFQTLRDLGRLTSTQETAISDALDKAAEGLTRTSENNAAAADAAKTPEVGTPDTRSKADVVGTFSSMNLGGLGYGSSLQERIAKASEETAKNTRNMGDSGKVAA